MMKIYQVNKELEEILLKHGFIEIKQYKGEERRKKCFKLTKTSCKGIYFDKDSLEIIHNSRKFICPNRLSEQELKKMLFFFKLKNDDFKEVCPFEEFSLHEIEKGITTLEKRINRYKELNKKQATVNKYQRLLDVYNDIEI